MNYLKLLNESFKEAADGRDEPTLEKMEFLADDIFGFTTYENVVSSMMAQKALEVCEAISYRKTFDYIASEDGNLWYLVMVNMPFFENKLEWGTSIRGAWWDLRGDKEFTIDSCGMFYEGKQILELKFNESEWAKFIESMIEFAQE